MTPTLTGRRWRLKHFSFSLFLDKFAFKPTPSHVAAARLANEASSRYSFNSSTVRSFPPVITANSSTAQQRRGPTYPFGLQPQQPRRSTAETRASRPSRLRVARTLFASPAVSTLLARPDWAFGYYNNYSRTGTDAVGVQWPPPRRFFLTTLKPRTAWISRQADFFLDFRRTEKYLCTYTDLLSVRSRQAWRWEMSRLDGGLLGTFTSSTRIFLAHAV